MKPERRLWVYLVEKSGSEEAAQQVACAVILDLIQGTSMGMLRCGKKARPIDSEYGGQ